VYGSNWSGKSVRAHHLAIERRNAFVHEIGGYNDLKLIAGSRYHHCIAVLNAGDESHARWRMERLASRAEVDLCPMTFEAAPHRR
ncbi:MAG: hypothetical protein ACTHJ3_05640, partial [Pararhizobium sp.]